MKEKIFTLKEMIGVFLLIGIICWLIYILYIPNDFYSGIHDFAFNYENSLYGCMYIVFFIFGLWLVSCKVGEIILGYFFRPTKKELEIEKATKEIEDKYKRIRLENKLNKLKK